ncbi:MAG: alpha-amylase family glycosyl hydrolase [Microbacteriaceae bacterium]
MSTRAVAAPAAQRWWRDAVIYQIYPRSFADGNGDGMGDLAGIEQHLDDIRRLGVDAIWLSPFYRSPQADAGYDVADYRDVDPLFGTLGDFDRMLARAHALGLKVIVDLVPNHTSSAHVWFQAALAAAPGSTERERYLFRDGRGTSGEEPPNNWQSVFGGPAWTRVSDGSWYLHLFDPGQPDLNWRNPEVVAEFQDILRFWLNRGVDGFRIDVAHGLIKHDDLPDWDQGAGPDGSGAGDSGPGASVPGDSEPGASDAGGPSVENGPMWDQDDVHEIYRGWNAVLAEYGGDRILVAEAWVSPAERLSRYVRHDEMQQAFNFIYMLAGWDALAMSRAIDDSLATNAAVGATTTWVLSNHDVVRHASRFGRSDPTMWSSGIGPDDEQPDAALGLSRARAATLLMLALPGSAYLYQGEELGLPEHTTLPAAVRRDPTFWRTQGVETGRDGCRVPLPWRADAPGYGFGPADGSGAAPWLPQPDAFKALAADQQDGVPGSTLEFYRLALALRHELGLGRGELRWRSASASVLDVEVSAAEHTAENNSVRVLVNFGPDPLPLPVGADVLLVSDAAALADAGLRPDKAVWLAVG